MRSNIGFQPIRYSICLHRYINVFVVLNAVQSIHDYVSVFSSLQIDYTVKPAHINVYIYNAQTYTLIQCKQWTPTNINMYICIEHVYIIRGVSKPLHWRHNGHDGISNHQLFDCLLNRLFGCRSKKTSKLRVTGFCVGNSPGTGEFPAQMASNAERVSIWWRHHALYDFFACCGSCGLYN